MTRTVAFIFPGTALFFLAFLLSLPAPDVNLEKPRESTQGSKDDPYGAARFRHDMLSGGREDLDLVALRHAAVQQARSMEKTSAVAEPTFSSWIEAGPGNIGGRIRAIVISPSNSAVILIGSVSGGIWKSSDGGATWAPKTDNLDPIAISTLLIDPFNSTTVYAGTGEGWFNVDATYGGGVFRSTDFGDSWALLPSTAGANVGSFRNVMQLAADPSGNLYAATKDYRGKYGPGLYYSTGGLYRSSDGGGTWAKISTTSVTNYYNPSDVVPITSSMIVLATGAGSSVGGIFYTTDGGASWAQSTAGLPTSGYGRIELTQDPSLATTLYAVYESSDITAAGDGGLKGIYRSVDGGITWSALTTPPKLTSTGGRSYLSAQGWYNNIMAVDPANPSTLYLGGVDMMKSTNGGGSWSQLTYWWTGYGTPYVHADHHAIIFDPLVPNTLYSGNDGGIYKSTNGGAAWTSLNNGLGITQFYGGAVSSTGSTFYGGTQDNGHLKFTSGTSWQTVVGGDGGYAAVNQTNSAEAYEEYVYLDIRKTTSSGASWFDAQTGLSDATVSSACLFIAPFSMNPQNSTVLIAGSNKVWVTTTSASSWTQVSSELEAGKKISAVTIIGNGSPYQGFAGTTGGKVFKCISLDPALGISNSWIDITPSGATSAYVRRIAVDLASTNRLYACYSGYNASSPLQSAHVWYSSNQGGSWVDISLGLPNAPVHSLIIDPLAANTLYVGTEVGVYTTQSNGASWSTLSSGMAAYVPVDELVLQTGTNHLFAFTHGRGVFQSSSALPVQISSFTASLSANGVELRWTTESQVNNYGFEVRRSGDAAGGFTSVGFVPGHGTTNDPQSYSFLDREVPAGRWFYRLLQIDNDGTSTPSEPIAVDVVMDIEGDAHPLAFEMAQNYPNPFNPSTDIQFSIPQASSVRLTVVDAAGRETLTLVEKLLEAGRHTVRFDASGLASGVYLAVLEARTLEGSRLNRASRKMLLLK